MLQSDTRHKGASQLIYFIGLSCLNHLNIWHFQFLWVSKHSVLFFWQLHMWAVHFNLLLATRDHCSQMALFPENGKSIFISLCNLNTFKPSSHAELQHRGQQLLLFPIKTLTVVNNSSCTIELMQRERQPVSVWRDLNLQFLLLRKIPLPADSETQWMRDSQPLLLNLVPCASQSHVVKASKSPELIAKGELLASPPRIIFVFTQGNTYRKPSGQNSDVCTSFLARSWNFLSLQVFLLQGVV